MWNGQLPAMSSEDIDPPRGQAAFGDPGEDRSTPGTSNHKIFRGRKCYPKNLAPDQTVKQVLKETNGQELKRCGVYVSF